MTQHSTIEYPGPTPGLTEALGARLPGLAHDAIVPLVDTGLAHEHLRLVGSGLLARLPKQSQMGLPPRAHLHYEAACFARAAPSGHTPRLEAVLEPSEALPRGALIVTEIEGCPARLPDDLAALGEALAAIHRLPITATPAPLLAPEDPLGAMLAEVERQAAFLPRAGLAATARRGIEQELARFRDELAGGDPPPRTLITFDAHPGNFVIDDHGRAWMVDLEKARYSHPGFDLAHASLYTSTTWDPQSHAVLTPAQVVDAYAAWEAAMGEAGRAHRAWHLPLRRAMWLWSITWCTKWRVASGEPAATGRGENWSRDNNSASLNAHVQDRVDHYLGAPIIERIRDEFSELARALAPQD
ncbi:phosphotransferase family protein [Halomonas salifodinae]|uniref:phosphotransferase family protein n=1 Tax=Halomonas salifodinae TaxID=438745 RepID=UPI0033BAA2F3